MFNVSRDDREVENCYRSYFVTKPTTAYIANSIIGCIVNLILCLVGSFLNVLVIYVFWKTPKLRFKVSYFMIMLLSSNDLLVTSIVHPSFLLNSITEIVGRASCVYKAIYHVATIVLALMSFETFFVMNVERYLSIVHPIYHITHVTKRRCLIACSTVWLPTITMTPVLYVLNWKVQVIITILAVIVVSGTCYIYYAIFRVARRARREHNVQKKEENPKVFVLQESAQNDVTLSDIETETLSEGENEDRKSEKINRRSNQNNLQCDSAKEKPSKTMTLLQDLQLAKIYLLVVFSTFALNFPNALLLALFQDRLSVVNGLVQAKIWSVTLVLFCSTINSLIFFWGNMSLRKEGWKVCQKLLRRQNLPQRH